MISRFSQYLVEEEKVVYFTFGRMNPPTIGHGKLLDVLASKAGRSPYKIFLSQSQDPKKNPLSYTDKIKSIRKMFPKHARNIMISKNTKTAMDVLTNLYNQGFRKVVMIVGSDRVIEFETLLNNYNGKESRHGFYNFMDIKVVSAGERDPDAEGAEGASGSKQRGHAVDNDFIKFSQGLPTTMDTKDSRAMFNAVRKGMGLKEEKHFKNHVSLESVSAEREAFVAGTLFGLGDSVVIKETQEVCNVVVLGSNYVIVERSDGMRFRKWLDAVEVVESNSGVQPDWGSDEAVKKAKSMTPAQEGAKPVCGLIFMLDVKRVYHLKSLGKRVIQKL
jgi:nicotinamide mononucleotide adenylyltransferase